MALPPDTKLDADAMIRVCVAAIAEAFTHAAEPMGFMLVIGQPDEGVRYASNMDSRAASTTLEGVIEALRLKAFEPLPGTKPN